MAKPTRNNAAQALTEADRPEEEVERPDDAELGDYEVGYKRPPPQHRFKPGQSGNPQGRRKGSRGLKTDLNAELDAIFTIQMNGRPMKGTKQRLMVMTLASRAATGDVKATKLLTDLILTTFGTEDRGGEREKLSPQDQALLEQLLADVDDDDLGADAEPQADGSGIKSVTNHPPADAGDMPEENGDGD